MYFTHVRLYVCNCASRPHSLREAISSPSLSDGLCLALHKRWARGIPGPVEVAVPVTSTLRLRHHPLVVGQHARAAHAPTLPPRYLAL